MANPNQDWEDLGRNIQDIIDQAINSQDYRKLNQTITRTVSHAMDVGGEAVRRAVDTYCPGGRFYPGIPNGVCYRPWNDQIEKDELKKYGREWALKHPIV